MLKILDYLSPQWETVHSEKVTLLCIVFFGRHQYETDATVLIQKSRAGRCKCLLVEPGGISKMDPLEVQAHLGFDPVKLCKEKQRSVSKQ